MKTIPEGIYYWILNVFKNITHTVTDFTVWVIFYFHKEFSIVSIFSYSSEKRLLAIFVINFLISINVL